MAKVDEVRSQLLGLRNDVVKLQAAVDSEKEEIFESLRRLHEFIDNASANDIPQDVADSIAELSANISGAVVNIANLVPTPDPLAGSFTPTAKESSEGMNPLPADGNNPLGNQGTGEPQAPKTGADFSGPSFDQFSAGKNNRNNR